LPTAEADRLQSRRTVCHPCGDPVMKRTASAARSSTSLRYCRAGHEPDSIEPLCRRQGRHHRLHQPRSHELGPAGINGHAIAAQRGRSPNAYEPHGRNALRRRRPKRSKRTPLGAAWPKRVDQPSQRHWIRRRVSSPVSPSTGPGGSSGGGGIGRPRSDYRVRRHGRADGAQFRESGFKLGCTTSTRRKTAPFAHTRAPKSPSRRKPWPRRWNGHSSSSRPPAGRTGSVLGERGSVKSAIGQVHRAAWRPSNPSPRCQADRLEAQGIAQC